MADSQKLKGLAVIFDPHNLQQFIWYYCTYGQDITWDALCLPGGYKGAYMEPYCVRAGIFSEIMTDDTEPLTMPYSKRIGIFLQMVLYYIVGKRKKYCKKMLNQYVGDIDQYNVLTTICDNGLVSGILALLGDEKEVVYFDDGTGDYYPRFKWKSPNVKSPVNAIQGFLLSHMGYGSCGRFYFEPTKYCCKFSAVTEEMQYRNYREMHDLDISKTDLTLYNDMLNRIYPEIHKIDFETVEAVFFTDDLNSFSSNYQKYNDALVRYIGEKYKSVLIKKHPRDFSNYKFESDVVVQEVDSEIPAEILLSFLKGKKLFFMWTSSIIIFMKPYNYHYSLLYLNELYNENKSAVSVDIRYGSVDEIRDYCSRFSGNNYEIIQL